MAVAQKSGSHFWALSVEAKTKAGVPFNLEPHPYGRSEGIFCVGEHGWLAIFAASTGIPRILAFLLWGGVLMSKLWPRDNKQIRKP